MMNTADQIVAGFHPVASRLLFAQLQAFRAASARVDRRAAEDEYRTLLERCSIALRNDLQAAARGFLAQHRSEAQIGAIDQEVRRLIQEYCYQFTQRNS